MSLLQLTELIPVETPLGDGYAILIESGGHDIYWTVALHNKALVTFTQDRIRICSSYTHRRGIDDERMKLIVNNQGENI
jgi:hypothetical protein